MPEIVFKGKEYVYNHHLTVPCRPLVVECTWTQFKNADDCLARAGTVG